MSSEEKTPNAEPSMSVTKTAEQSTSETSANASALEVAKDQVSVSSSTPESDNYIRLRVITSDMNNEVHFRVKELTSLGRLKSSYSKKVGLQLGELRFLFDGERISDENTPRSLKMVDDDVIEVYQERVGGM